MNIIRTINNKKQLFTLSKRNLGLFFKKFDLVSPNQQKLSYSKHQNYGLKYCFSSSITHMELESEYTEKEENLYKQKSDEKITNPEKYSDKRFFRDIYASNKMTVKDFAYLLNCTVDELMTSINAFKSINNKNEVLSLEEMELLAYEYDCILLNEKIDLNKLSK